ncbi:MAG: DNA polymerase III subunit delta [Lachnospiraceae bacterium]|nr:DNA polymerase III subunit delta [Lachnospiraceae bacterium]
MKQLEADIKNGIYKRIYLLHGPQSYLRTSYVKALTARFLDEGDSMNLTKYYGAKVDIKEVTDTALTMPFFAPRRVIVCENTGLFTRACEELADFIPDIPETSVMIFSEEKIDKRLRQTKAAASTGCIAQFSDLSDAELSDRIVRRLAKEHRPITRSALDLFMARCGDDMWQISNELEKVISYTFKKDGIRDADVDAVCPSPPQDRVFNMIDAILAGDAKKAVAFYMDLILLQSDPAGIISLIRDQYRLMLHIKQMSEENLGIGRMAEVLKVREVRVKMALPVSKKSSKIRLAKGIKLCADTEQRIKTGDVDKKIAAETLIIELSRS